MLNNDNRYGVELTIMIVATLGQAVAGSGPATSYLGVLIMWRFIMGIGIGGWVLLPIR